MRQLKLKNQHYVAVPNGRLAFKALEEFYEGVGLHSIDIIRADEGIDSLFYVGDKKPHTWWEEFKK